LFNWYKHWVLDIPPLSLALSSRRGDRTFAELSIEIQKILLFNKKKSDRLKVNIAHTYVFPLYKIGLDGKGWGSFF
jgi:hypothetical protein